MTEIVDSVELRCICCEGFVGEFSGDLPRRLRVRCPDRECRCWTLFQNKGDRVIASQWLSPRLGRPGDMVE